MLLVKHLLCLSGTSRSGRLSPSARSPSTLVSVGNSLGLSSDVVASGPSSNVYHNAPILSQKPACSTSPPTHKKQHVSSSSVKQASIPVHDCSAPTLMIADELMDVDATPVHRIVEKQKGTSTKAIQVSNAQSAAFVIASRSRSGLPPQTHQRSNSRSSSLPPQTPVPNIPTPEQIDASRPAPSHARRQRQPRGRLNNSIATSAKFRLSICPCTSRGMRKRSRIILYRPPPHTATVDIASLESRYALVRGAMCKVRTLYIKDMDSPSLFQ
ncbi:hypothetical protein BJV78DRAFT_1198144 [Lactifluus subvellereus]|nr:hypothetical protein BJV78DRAFT_1198144 [Lactifluus subvellereus]